MDTAGWTLDYEPAAIADVEEILDHLGDRPDATFVDLGCGKGRVLILAARRRFRRVVGVEIVPSLASTARWNVQRPDALRRSHDIAVVEGDAGALPLPLGPLVLFLYNPFEASIVASVARRAGAVGATIVLAYPREEKALLDAGFREVARRGASDLFDDWRVYSTMP